MCQEQERIELSEGVGGLLRKSNSERQPVTEMRTWLGSYSDFECFFSSLVVMRHILGADLFLEDLKVFFE